MIRYETAPFAINPEGLIQILTPEAALLARCALPTFEMPMRVDFFRNSQTSNHSAYPIELNAPQTDRLLAFSRSTGLDSTPLIEHLSGALIDAMNISSAA